MMPELDSNALSDPLQTSLQQQAPFLVAKDNAIDAKLLSEMLQQAFSQDYDVVCLSRYEQVMASLAASELVSLVLYPSKSSTALPQSASSVHTNSPRTLPLLILACAEDVEQGIPEYAHQPLQSILDKKRIKPAALCRALHAHKQHAYILQRLATVSELTVQPSEPQYMLVNQDSLTGLPNRAYFLDEVSRVLKQAKRQGKLFAIAYFDVDGFKKVNDTYGHVIADELLVAISLRLRQVIGQHDFLAHLGGDEFAIVTDVLDIKYAVYPLARALLDSFERPFLVGMHQIIAPVSLGIAFYPDATDVDQLVKHADCARSEAKSFDESKVCFYTQKMAAQFSRHQWIESELSRALTKHEIVSWLQPIRCINDKERIYAESLSRWHSHELGWVSPGEFIPIAEHTPAINDITRNMVSNISEFIQHLQLNPYQTCRIAVNVSATQLNSDCFAEMMLGWLERFQVSPYHLCVELTERQMVTNMHACLRNVERLRSEGVEIALDDFGTGYSSITHLIDFPLDTLKLDRILIDKIDQNPRNRALTSGIVEMAHGLGMSVVAEGVERAEEFRTVTELGCDYVQGYYVSKPLPMEEAGVVLHINS